MRVTLLAILSAFAFVAAAPAAPVAILALEDVRPGMIGIGRTVFEGSRIDEFKVEIIGVMENVSPRQSMILARLEGGPLANTGVIAGMSGSPVYIDGKLVGAVAYLSLFAFPSGLRLELVFLPPVAAGLALLAERGLALAGGLTRRPATP